MRHRADADPYFDTRSVLLFAALTMGTGLAWQARAAASAPTASSTSPQARAMPPAAGASALDSARAQHGGVLARTEPGAGTRR